MGCVIEKIAFKYSSSSPETCICACVSSHMHTPMQASFEVSPQTITTAELEGIKSKRLSSFLSQFSSLHGAATSRISKARFKRGWLTAEDFPASGQGKAFLGEAWRKDILRAKLRNLN